MAKYSYYNPNPLQRSVSDCTVRALSKALNQSWEETYVGLCLEGFQQADLLNSDLVWSKYLYDRGFKRHFIPDDGLGKYTVSDFADDHPKGVFVVSMPGQHVVTVVDGVIYDSWRSENECPTYYFAKENRTC